jgi:hypothetical protein
MLLYTAELKRPLSEPLAHKREAVRVSGGELRGRSGGKEL